MASAEQIHRFFPKAAGVDEHASKVATVEIPATDLLLTANGAPVLWVKAKKSEEGVVVCVYTTVGVDFNLAIRDLGPGNPGAKGPAGPSRSKQKQAKKRA